MNISVVMRLSFFFTFKTVMEMRNSLIVWLNALINYSERKREERETEARTMWFRPEMSSIFYVESDCEAIKVAKDEVNDLFMLKQLMPF